MKHFKYRPGMDDVELFEKGYDRVYDTLELEGNLDATERVVRDVLRGWDPARTLSSRALLEELGQYLLDHQLGPAVLASAKKHGVPVYVPAFTDSEMGLDVALFNEARTEAGEKSLDFNPFLDLDDFRRRAVGQKKLGIFTIGGGVPRNWAQQVACYEDLRRARLGKEGEEPVRYRYGIRICPEPVHWGGLSGCTYSEGVSWGKFVPEAEGGRFAEVMADATIAWPLLLRGVIERLAGAGTASRPR
jgi:deoxyhypusine synthase